MTKDEIRAYIAHHAGDRSIRQIAKHCGISRQEVRDVYDEVCYLPVHCFPRPAHDHMVCEMTWQARDITSLKKEKANRDAEILKLHREGVSIKSIVKRLGVSEYRVYIVLDNAGIHRKKVTQQQSLMAAVTEKWKTWDELNDGIGAHDSAIAKALKALSVAGRLEKQKGEGGRMLYRLKEAT